MGLCQQAIEPRVVDRQIHTLRHRQLASLAAKLGPRARALSKIVAISGLYDLPHEQLGGDIASPGTIAGNREIVTVGH
jgi:hypothetical protein